MNLLFASTNHMGLNSNIAETIYSAKYFTYVHIENNSIKKVINIENTFENNGSFDNQAFLDLFLQYSVDYIFSITFDETINNALISHNIVPISNYNGRVADVLSNFEGR